MRSGIRMTRRSLLGLGCAAASGILTACAGATTRSVPGSPAGTVTEGSPRSMATATPASSVTSEPVWVGLLVALSGSFASLGEHLVRGLELALDEVGGQATGRAIIVQVEDSAGNPEQALAKARQLVERERVHILAGVTLSSEAGALRDSVVAAGIPLLVRNAGLPGLTRDPKRRSPLIFRVSFADGQHEAPFGRYADEKLGDRRVVLTGLDYSAGHAKLGAFGRHFQAAGGRIVGEYLHRSTRPTMDPTCSGSGNTMLMQFFLSTPGSMQCASFSNMPSLACWSGHPSSVQVRRSTRASLRNKVRPGWGSSVPRTGRYCTTRLKTANSSSGATSASVSGRTSSSIRVT